MFITVTKTKARKSRLCDYCPQTLHVGKRIVLVVRHGVNGVYYMHLECAQKYVTDAMAKDFDKE